MIRRHLIIIAGALFVATNACAASLAIDMPGVSIPLETPMTTAGATLTVSGPNGVVAQHALGPADGGRFKLPEASAFGDGQYR